MAYNSRNITIELIILLTIFLLLFICQVETDDLYDEMAAATLSATPYQTPVGSGSYISIHIAQNMLRVRLGGGGGGGGGGVVTISLSWVGKSVLSFNSIQFISNRF